jgi:hypothetical protein
MPLSASIKVVEAEVEVKVDTTPAPFKETSHKLPNTELSLSLKEVLAAEKEGNPEASCRDRNRRGSD